MDRWAAEVSIPRWQMMDISRTGFLFMVKFVANLTAEAACALLRSFGMTFAPEDVQVVARDGR